MNVASLPARENHAEADQHTAPLIFVIDDSALMRKIFTVSLQRAQFRVRCFEHGLELLRALHEGETERPDLLLLDIGLPHMNGFQVAHALKQQVLTRGCPLVIVSRRTGLLDRLRGHLLGACAWLDKPFTTQGLLDVVRAALAHPTLAPGASSSTMEPSTQPLAAPYERQG